jgi:AraC-like DNA-binding protein
MAVSHLDAQRRYPVHIVQQGHIALIGVRFRPGGLAAFLPMPMSEIEGLTLDLPGIFGSTGLELEQRLFEAAGDRSLQATLLDGFFLRQVTVRPAHAVVAHMIATIDRHHGQMTVRDLSRTSGYSVRMVDRLFQRVVGLSPKFYSRVVRLRHTLHALVQHPAVPWADLAACSGYYDQPHFTKEFATLTGLRPEEYRPWVERHRRTPAPNHVQFVQDNLESEPVR